MSDTLLSGLESAAPSKTLKAQAKAPKVVNLLEGMTEATRKASKASRQELAVAKRGWTLHTRNVMAGKYDQGSLWTGQGRVALLSAFMAFRHVAKAADGVATRLNLPYTKADGESVNAAFWLFDEGTTPEEAIAILTDKAE